MITQIGIIINIIVFIFLIVCLKTTKYINLDDICEYNDKHEPISVNSWTTWDKAWHTIKLPLWQYIFLMLLIPVSYLGTIFYILFAVTDIHDDTTYYYKKPISLKKLNNIIKKFIKLITIKI